MLSCKEVSRLASESLDQRLPLGKRIGVRMHLMMCRACARFLRQIKFLRHAGRVFDEKTASLEHLPPLAPEAGRRIRDALKEKE